MMHSTRGDGSGHDAPDAEAVAAHVLQFPFFCFFHANPLWRRLREEEWAHGRQEFAQVVAQAQDVTT